MPRQAGRADARDRHSLSSEDGSDFSPPLPSFGCELGVKIE